MGSLIVVDRLPWISFIRGLCLSFNHHHLRVCGTNNIGDCMYVYIWSTSVCGNRCLLLSLAILLKVELYRDCISSWVNPALSRSARVWWRRGLLLHQFLPSVVISSDCPSLSTRPILFYFSSNTQPLDRTVSMPHESKSGLGTFSSDWFQHLLYLVYSSSTPISHMDTMGENSIENFG